MSFKTLKTKRFAIKRAIRSDGWRRGIVAAVILIGTFSALLLFNRNEAQSPTGSVALMSSIDLRWGEADIRDIAAGKAQPAELVRHLSIRNKVQFLDDLLKLDALSADVLVLVQPRRLSPAELVALDKWTVEGGQLIIFADPALQWPTHYPLGDSRRPLFTSMLSPLFAHWGIELALPMNGQGEKSEAVTFDRQTINVQSRGIWLPSTTNKSTRCKIDPTEFVADCKIGKGRALLFADADMVHDALWNYSLIRGNQMDWLGSVIVAMAQKQPWQGR